MNPVRTQVCAECFRPVRVWHRRVWITNTHRRVAHRACWRQRQTAKELVASQIAKHTK